MNWMYRDKLVRDAYALAGNFPSNANVSEYLLRKRIVIHEAIDRLSGTFTHIRVCGRGE